MSNDRTPGPGAAASTAVPPRRYQAVVERELDGRPDEVFGAFSDADRLRDWLTGEGEATVDFQVGGAFTLLMRLGGGEIRYHGKYLRIEAPDTVAFTWLVEGDKDESVVRVQLEAAGERTTRLSLVHGALKSERLARDYELAWTGFLGILAHQMEAQVGWRD
jgi:uncharacterized protein YndB with AHSA1/START domain